MGMGDHGAVVSSEQGAGGGEHVTQQELPPK